MLSKDVFSTVVKNAPLVAVDFIIQNLRREVLLGKRRNRPAQGFYFTFGGIVNKDERIDDAIRRVSKNELGYEFHRSDLEFNGVFEFFYEENFLNEEEFTTHYIVLSFVFMDEQGVIHPEMCHENNTYMNQHSDFIWLKVEDVLRDGSMHQDLKTMLRGQNSLHTSRGLFS